MGLTYARSANRCAVLGELSPQLSHFLFGSSNVSFEKKTVKSRRKKLHDNIEAHRRSHLSFILY